MFNISPLTASQRVCQLLARVVVCLMLVMICDRANASILLPDIDVSVSTSSGSGDTTEDSQTEEPALIDVGSGDTATSMAPQNFSTIQLVVGLLNTGCDCNEASLILQNSSQIVLKFDNPFLDGILKPPIA